MLLKSNLSESNEQVIKKTQLLLDNPDSKESKRINFISSIAPASKNAREFYENTRKVGISIEKSKFTAKYGKTYHRDEIVKECLKYNLTLIKLHNFEGSFGDDLIDKINDYVDNNKDLFVGVSDIITQVYVMGTAVGDTELNTMSSKVKDPLVFIKLEGQYYVLIDGSRNYIGLFSLWQGWKNKNSRGMHITYTIENFLAIVIMSHIVAYFANLHVPWWMYLLFLVGGFGTHFIRSSNRNSCYDDHQKYGYFNDAKVLKYIN